MGYQIATDRAKLDGLKSDALRGYDRDHEVSIIAPKALLHASQEFLINLDLGRNFLELKSFQCLQDRLKRDQAIDDDFKKWLLADPSSRHR